MTMLFIGMYNSGSLREIICLRTRIFDVSRQCNYGNWWAMQGFLSWMYWKGNPLDQLPILKVWMERQERQNRWQQLKKAKKSNLQPLWTVVKPTFQNLNLQNCHPTQSTYP